MVSTNVAGDKILQDSVQNIFENQQKQAYADYLDRLPQDRAEKPDQWEHIAGGDGFYHLKNKITGETKPTTIKVPPRLINHGTGSAPLGFFQAQDNDPSSPTYGQMVWMQGDKFKGGMTPAKTPSGAPAPGAPDPARKAEAQTAKITADEAKELEMTDAILRGTYKDKNKQTVKFNQEHATRYNQLSSQPEAAFVKDVPSRILGIKEPTVVRKPVPGGLPVRDAYKQYQFFTKEGGRGSFEDFIANPDIMAQVAAAMRK